MTSKKIEGVNADLDVVAIVKAFEAFKDELQLACDKSDKLLVDLAFETSLDAKTHYNFQQDEVVTLSGCKINPHNRKVIFTAVYGANDKVFYIEDTELIEVYETDDTSGSTSKKSFKVAIDEAFTKTFPGDLKMHSVVALQAMVRNNPGLVDILNDPSKFLEEIEIVGARSKAYAVLTGFGRY